MAYVDGFVLPVPKKNIAAYRKMATTAGKVWREQGALDYKECIADDVKKGKSTSFPQAVKLKPGETMDVKYPDATRWQAAKITHIAPVADAASGSKPGSGTRTASNAATANWTTGHSIRFSASSAT